ncbi:MAG: hypothetical protein EP332_10595 [Bacteroidetes bacterium]|nr:MAG: hypothetical protein EP332_10595 [Bacteroidota bacterium]
MRGASKLLVFWCILGLAFSAKASDSLSYMADSVLHAVQETSVSKLQDLVPSYADLKTVYDSTDEEMMNYQIGIRQKELEFLTRRDMKRLAKFAKREKIGLNRLEKVEEHLPIATNEKGYRYARSFMLCNAGNRQFKLHFVLIELNNQWFYGEGLSIEEIQVAKEIVPDYDKIDADLEKRREDREKARLKAIEDKRKAEEAEKKRIEKEELEKKKQAEKEEKARLKKEKEEKKQKEKEEKERLKKEKELKKKQEQEEKERLKKEKEEQKKKELEEKERLKKEKEKRLKKEKEEREERLKKEKKERERQKKEEEEKKKNQPDSTGRNN